MQRDIRFAPIVRRSRGSFSQDVRACRSRSVQGHAIRLNRSGVKDGSCIRAIAAGSAP
jgi:hypothetical protein